MPYIKQERRADLTYPWDQFQAAQTPGELNYQITQLIRDYYRTRPEYKGDGPTSYQVINDIVGALEGAKMEFYRRIAAPYEDTKIKENGDVY